MEFSALASPTSPPSSFVKAGFTDENGLKSKITSVFRTSAENGSKK